MIESPCIDVCRLEPNKNVCVGCMRTLEEIASWSSLSDLEKTTILNRIWGDDVRNDSVPRP